MSSFDTSQYYLSRTKITSLVYGRCGNSFVILYHDCAKPVKGRSVIKVGSLDYSKISDCGLTISDCMLYLISTKTWNIEPGTLNLDLDCYTKNQCVMKPLKRRNALSGREYEVMVLVSSGKYNKEIAEELKCDVTTIKKHLQNIFPKLEVQNRTEATLKFLKISHTYSSSIQAI
jgi:DNA-binding CsgD family transcriptional regulator